MPATSVLSPRNGLSEMDMSRGREEYPFFLDVLQRKIAILFENESLIIVDKPTDSIVHGIKGDDNTLLEMVQRYLESSGRSTAFLAPANRLDRNTSGPVVFTKDKETARCLRKLYAQCNIQKTYAARLNGILRYTLFVEADIIKGHHKRAAVRNLIVSNQGSPDKRQWFSSRIGNSDTVSATVLRPVSWKDGTTVAEIYPWTGRYHQIRVICQAIGFPITGDKKYDRVPGSNFNKEHSHDWMVQSLICTALQIEEWNIAVVSTFSLDDVIHQLPLVMKTLD